MSYMNAELSGSLHAQLATLPRDAAGLFTVRTPAGRFERTARADIALLLIRSNGGGGRTRAQPSAKQLAAVARARRLVARADAVLAKSAPAPFAPLLTAQQREAINRVKPADLAEAMGRALARELQTRDRRLHSIEQRLPRDPAALRQRSRLAIRRVDAALAS